MGRIITDEDISNQIGGTLYNWWEQVFFCNGYDNFLTLEPHLSLAEANYGRTTPELFKSAVVALNDILG